MSTNFTENKGSDIGQKIRVFGERQQAVFDYIFSLP